MTIKTYESIVLNILEKNKLAREDDFILYGAVLRKLGVGGDKPLFDFLATAKKNKMPSFETITRCRRHIQALRYDLVESKTAIVREERKEDFVLYNRSGIGE